MVLGVLTNIYDYYHKIPRKNRKPPVWVATLYNLAPCYLPAVAVLSPLLGLTSVFGMVTGISPALWAPMAQLNANIDVHEV